MSPKVTAEIARLPDFTVNQLVERYAQVFGEECRSRNKQYLVRRIAWRLQANDEGGLSQAAIAQAKKLAGDAAPASSGHSTKRFKNCLTANAIKLAPPFTSRFSATSPRRWPTLTSWCSTRS